MYILTSPLSNLYMYILYILTSPLAHVYMYILYILTSPLAHVYKYILYILTSPLAHLYMWATSWENLLMPYANNNGADQPAHPRSLISTFVVRCLDSIISLLAIAEISSL